MRQRCPYPSTSFILSELLAKSVQISQIIGFSVRNDCFRCCFNPLTGFPSLNSKISAVSISQMWCIVCNNFGYVHVSLWSWWCCIESKPDMSAALSIRLQRICSSGLTSVSLQTAVELLGELQLWCPVGLGRWRAILLRRNRTILTAFLWHIRLLFGMEDAALSIVPIVCKESVDLGE